MSFNPRYRNRTVNNAERTSEDRVRRIFFDKFYFEALVNQDNPRDLERKRDAIGTAAKESLEPYLSFIKNSIDAEKKKADYECKFKIIKSNDSYKLEWQYPRFSISRSQITPIIFLFMGDNELKEEKNRLILETHDIMVTFSKDDAVLSPDKKRILSIKNNPEWDKAIEKLGTETNLSLNNNKIEFSFMVPKIAKGSEIVQDGKKYVIRNVRENEQNIIFDIDTQRSFLTTKDSVRIDNYEFSISPVHPKPEKLFFKNNRQQWDFVKEDDEYFSEDAPGSLEVLDEQGEIYRLVPYNNSKKGRNRVIIQLLDNDNVEEGEKSACDYFLENEMLQEIYQSEKKDSFKVIKSRPDEHQLYVEKSSKNGNSLDPNLPIKMVIDTNNLIRQQNAIMALLKTPVNEHRNLIRLFENKDLLKEKNRSIWPQNFPKKVDEDKWFVLNNRAYQGTESQRNFVERALGTNDYMLLEGPPGSGKTTAILELILQFIKEGKRVLLSASTHVAIDNILERIKEYPDVSPLRIGRESSIGETVKDFSIDNKKNELMEKGWDGEVAERFLLDSSNLVCGTTMGIQNHPDFRWKKEERRIPVPLYDVMVIDEASKTTFQEFIVPALYAKKWIIIGDVQQLSPYTEKEYLKAHLTQSIDEKTQQLCAIINHLNTLKSKKKKGFDNPECIPFPLALELPIGCTIEDLKKYKTERFDQIPQKIAYIKNKKLFDYDTDKEISWLNLYVNELLLLEASNLNASINFIPEFYYIVSFVNKDIANEGFSRRQRLLDGEENNEIRFKDSDNLKNFMSRSWSDEVSWRLVRKFERRNLKESNYEQDLQKLIPENDNKTSETIEDVEHIFFPSILELLQLGNKEIQKFRTTLTAGFDEEDLMCRFERLDYQHRMHPDISKFSREHFYGAQRGVAELKDGQEIDRKWGYNRYPSRAVWLDVKRDKFKERQNTKVNKNYTECDVIKRELECFIQWAKDPSNLPESKNGEKWNVAILSYYRPQEGLIREMLQKYTGQPNKISHFKKDNVEIQLYTIDKFQGREADIVFISMCRNKGIGFMDNTNRMNVALTRAKYQRVIVGDKALFENQHFSDELRDLAKRSTPFSG